MADPLPQDYLVVNIHVEKITYKEVKVNDGSAYGKESAVKRDKGEVARFVVRAADIEDLRKKVSGHMELVDDEIIGDEGGATR